MTITDGLNVRGAQVGRAGGGYWACIPEEGALVEFQQADERQG